MKTIINIIIGAAIVAGICYGLNESRQSKDYDDVLVLTLMSTGAHSDILGM